MENSFTILIPCYNEAAYIGLVIKQLLISYPNILIIVVDNDSNDGSANIIKKFPVLYLKELKKGKGYAIRLGLKFVTTEYVVLHDADNEYEISHISKLLQTQSTNNKLLMRVGVRSRKKMMFSSILANLVIKILLYGRYGKLISDCLSGMRIVPTYILKKCKSAGFEIETEINKLCLMHKIPIQEVPIDYYPRVVGKKIKFLDIFSLIKMSVTL